MTSCEISNVLHSTLDSLEETIAETQTVPENLPEVLNDFEEEEEVRHKFSTFSSSSSLNSVSIKQVQLKHNIINTVCGKLLECIFECF